MWRRDDGTFAVVQTWATSYNDKFRADFTVWTENPDPSRFSPQAAEEFQRACVALFGPAAAKEKILYCHKTSTNDRKVYVGTRAVLLSFLGDNAAVRAELNILRVSKDGFVAGTVDGKGTIGTKPFTLAATGEYALYTKLGWETMACPTPLDQFMESRELRQ